MDSAVLRNLKLTLSYDGTDFAGFQTQPGVRTVQAELERAITRITGDDAKVAGAGRTDAGVHALAQVVSLRSFTRIPCDSLVRALNSVLSPDVRVALVADVHPEFHARKSAVAKRYEYRVATAPILDVFTRRYAWQICTPLDHEAMGRAGSHILGKHDFTAFQAAGSPKASAVRTVRCLEVYAHGCGLTVGIEADGFLYKMVRNIAGCLVAVGRGRLEPHAVGALLERRDRSECPPTAPAHGLFLVRVEY